MFPEEFQSVLMRLLSIYSAQLGVILGGIFAQPGRSAENPPAGVAAAALSLGLFWNFVSAGARLPSALPSTIHPPIS